MKRYFLVPHDHPNQNLDAGTVLVWEGLTATTPASEPEPEQPLLLMRPIYSNWHQVHHLQRGNLIEFVPESEPEPPNFPYGKSKPSRRH
jgi:hypothetical protein